MQRNVKAFLRFLGVLILVLGIWCMGSGVAEQTVKAPDITAPVYILAGQDLSFTVNTVEGAQAYSVVVYDYKGPADELYHSDRAGTHTLTSLASNTIYRLTANARFEDDVYMYTSYDVIVLDQEPSDTEITFLTSKTEVQPSEAFGIAAIAPGAAQLVLYNGNEEYTANHKDTQGNLYLTAGWSYDKPYTGDVYVKAYYPDGTTRESSHIQMNCQTQGSVDCGALSIPVSVTQGNALTFDVPSASNLADIESSGSSVIYYVKVDDRNTEERICDLRLKKADGVYKCYSWSDAIIDWQEQDNAQPFQVTVAADKLSEGHIYDVSVEASAKGWNTAYVDSSTIVTAGQSAQTVTLLVNGASDDFETTSNTDFTVTVDAPGATAVRLRNDYEWLYFDSRNHPAHVEEVMAFGKGTSSIFAQACYEEYDPDQVDWDTLNWTGTSNVIRITATTPSGRLAKAQVEAESLTVARGQDLILHITKLGLPSEWYWADIARQEVNEKDELYWRWGIGNSGHWDWDKEASCLTIPTYELEPGLYWANVAVDAAGYDPTWTALFFTVTDPGEQAMDFDFRVTSTSIYTHDNIKVTVYVEGAEETGLEVVKEGDPNWRDMRLGGGALNIWDWSTDQNGIYYMTPIGHCYTLDGQGNVVYGEDGEPVWTERRGESIQINVSTEGELEPAEITGVPMLMETGSALQAACAAVEGAEWYEWSLTYCSDTEDWQDLMYKHMDAGQENVIQLPLDGSYFSREGRYRINVSVGARHKDSSYAEKFFYVSETIDQSLELTLQGADASVTDWPAHRNMHFQVRADGASAVRFMKPDGNWEYRHGSARDDFGFLTYDINPDPGTVQVMAQAAYDGYRDWLAEDFDWDSFDWDQFDWNAQGYTWSKTSNVITVSVVSQGPANAAEFTVPESVIRGEVLTITIHGAGEGAARATAFSANIDDRQGIYIDGVTDFPVVLTLPTGDLEAGEYTVDIGAVCEGYDWTGSTATFRVTEPEEADPFIFSIAEPVIDRTNFAISAYEPDASWIGLWVRDKQNGSDFNEYGRYPGNYMNASSLNWNGGEYEVYAEAHYEDENGNEIRAPRESEHKTVTVAFLGSLDKPVILLNSASLNAGEDLNFQVEGLDQGADFWWDVQVKDLESGSNGSEMTTVARWTANDGAVPQSFTVSRDVLAAGHGYQISAWVDRNGYRGAGNNAGFAVMSPDSTALELTLQGQTGNITDWPAHKHMHFRLSAEGASAVRFMRADGSWEYKSGTDRDEAGFYTFDWDPEAGPIQAVAQAAYDGYRDWLEEDFDWGQFDWGNFDWNAQGYTWSRTSNSITVSVVSQGPANAAEFTVPESVIRGEVLAITINGAGEGAAVPTAFSANLHDREGVYMDGVTDFPVVLTLPTGDLEAGEYTVEISATREGYDWTTSSATFLVTEPSEVDPFIFSIAEPVIDRRNFSISAYEPNASWIRLMVWNKENGSDFEEYGIYPGNYMNAPQYWNGGEYEVYAEAHYEDENGNEIREPRESEHRTVTVAYLGSLNAPVIEIDSTVVNAGEDLAFQVNGIEQGAGHWWTVYVEDSDSRDENGNRVRVATWSETDGAVPETFTVSRELLTAGHGYHIKASVARSGYHDAWSDTNFAVVEAGSEPLELTLQGKNGDNSEWPVHKNMHFRLRADGASAVRFMNPYGEWEYRDGRNRDEAGYYTLDCNPDAGNVTVFAQAAYDGFRDWLADDFDWNSFDWGTFDWNAQGYTWSGMSNSITLNVVSNGPSNAAEFSVPESIARGEVLTITINGAGEGDGKGTYFSANIDQLVGASIEASEFPAVITLPTGDVEAGEYTVIVSAMREGYEWTDSFATLLVTEPAEAEPFIFSIPEPLIADTGFAISAYEPNASWIRLKVWNKQNSSGFEDYGDYPGNNMNLFTNWSEGEYEVYAEAHYEDENGNVVRQPRESEHRTVTVVSLGSLSDPVIIMDSDVIYTGANLTFEVEGLDPVSGCRWSVTVEDQDSRNDQGNPVRVAEWTQSDGVLPESFTVSSDLLTPNHLYSIKSHVEKNGYGRAYAEKHFTVLVQSSGEPLELFASASGDMTAWPQGEYLSFSLKADGASAVRFLGFDGNWQYMDGKHQQWDGYFSYGGNPAKGKYTILAQAAYDGFRDWLSDDFDWSTVDWNTFDWNAQGYTWEATSNIIHVSVVSLGTLAAPVYSIEKTDVTRGEPFVIHITGQDRNEWYSARFENEEGVVYEYSSWDSMAGIMTVETTDYMSGTYSMTLSSVANGYDGASADPVTVTIREPEENEIVFYAPETALIGENHPVRVYAPGALRIGYGIDGKAQHLDENGNYIGWDTGETWSTSNWFTMDDVGEHTLTAYVQYADGGDWVTVDRQVNVIGYGKLVLDTSLIPTVFSADDTTTVLSIPMPEHAEHKDVYISENWNDSDGFHSETVFSASDLSTWLTIPVPTVRGHVITLNINASARGYESLSFFREIQVTAPVGADAELIMNADDTTRLPVCQDVEFVVRPADGKTIAAVRFYDGNRYWEDGNEITPENHSDWFNAEGDFSVWNSYCDETNPERDYTVFAEVLLEGSNAWMRTNEFHFSTYADAYVGDFGFADVSSITAERGEMVTVAFTPAENATRYWVNIYGINLQMVSEGTTVTFSTADLAPGFYTLMGNAGGGAGVVSKSAWCMCDLTITEPSDTEMVIRTSKDTVEISEVFTISVYAPGATRIKVAHMDEENVWWDSEGDSLSANGILNDGIGEQTFYVSAMYDGNWSTPETVRIMLVANGELLPPEVSFSSTQIAQGQDFTFHVAMPEGAEYYTVWANRNEDGSSVYDGRDFYEDQDITISCSHLAVNESFTLTVRSNARGMQPGYFNATIRVVDGTPQAGTPTFVLPAALREIGEQAFEGISAEVVKVSDTVESIGNRAFAYSSIGQVILPASLVSIADDAFEGCSMLVFAPEGSYAWNWAVNHGFDVIGH